MNLMFGMIKKISPKGKKKEQFGEIRMSVEINFFIIYCQRTENQAIAIKVKT